MLIKYAYKLFPSYKAQDFKSFAIIIFLSLFSNTGFCSEATASFNIPVVATFSKEIAFCNQKSVFLALTELNRILFEKACIKKFVASLSDDYKVVQIQLYCLTNPPTDSQRHDSLPLQTICKMLQESKSFGDLKLVDAKRVRFQNPPAFGWEFQLDLKFYVEKEKLESN